MSVSLIKAHMSERKRKCKANRECEIVFKKKWSNIFRSRHVGLFNTNTDGADWLTDVLYSMEAFPLFISQFLHESFISLTMQLFRRILNQSNVLFSRISNHYHKCKINSEQWKKNIVPLQFFITARSNNFLKYNNNTVPKSQWHGNIKIIKVYQNCSIKIKTIYVIDDNNPCNTAIV